MDVSYEEKLQDMSAFDRGYKAGLHARDTATWQLDSERAWVRERLEETLDDECLSYPDIMHAVLSDNPSEDWWRDDVCRDVARKLVHLLSTTIDRKPDVIKFAEVLECAADRRDPVTLFGVDYVPVIPGEEEELEVKPTAITGELRAWIDGHHPYPGGGVYVLGDVALGELAEIAGQIDMTHLSLLNELADFERLNDVVSVEHVKLKQAIGAAKNRFDTLADDFERSRSKLASDGYYSRLYNQAWSNWMAARKRVEELEELLRDARDEYVDLERKVGGAERVASLSDVGMGVAAEDTPEAIVRDLFNGAATRSEAIRRIEALHG